MGVSNRGCCCCCRWPATAHGRGSTVWTEAADTVVLVIFDVCVVGLHSDESEIVVVGGGGVSIVFMFELDDEISWAVVSV